MNAAEDIRSLAVKVLKTKAIYHTLNMFNMDVTHKCLIAEVWAPVRDMDRINEAIIEGTVSASVVLQYYFTNYLLPLLLIFRILI